ncbi:MAG: PTS sugar transporter subunit IIA [bacterium]
MMLSDLLSERLVSADLKADGKLAVLDELAHLISRAHEEIDPAVVSRALLDRERIQSTAVGQDVAIPHAKTAVVDQIIACVGISRAGVDFDAEDGSLTRLFFTLLAPESSAGEHLKVLARISRLCQKEEIRTRLLAAESATSILEVIRQEEQRL